MIAFTRSFYGDWRSDVEQVLLARYQLPPRRKVKALSKGMRTKLALLLALARRPRLLILDEPSEGLDPVSIEELLAALKDATAAGTTIFFSSHQIAEVERIADRVTVINRGRLAIPVVSAGLAALPALDQWRWLNILNVMSGSGMPYLDPRTRLLIELPGATVAVVAMSAVALMAVAAMAARRDEA